jgi:mRNA-degrading endonuclease RelE of RelBE toxin-antitoxin system
VEQGEEGVAQKGPMMYRIEIKPIALKDLDSLPEYVVKKSVDAIDEFQL